MKATVRNEIQPDLDGLVELEDGDAAVVWGGLVTCEHDGWYDIPYAPDVIPRFNNCDWGREGDGFR